MEGVCQDAQATPLHSSEHGKQVEACYSRHVNRIQSMEIHSGQHVSAPSKEAARSKWSRKSKLGS